MKSRRRDIRKLHRPLLGVLATLALAGTLFAWSNSQHEEARQQNAAARLRKNQLEQRLRQAGGEIHDLEARSRSFRQLQESGMIGEEKRLEWLETLQTIQREQHLSGLNYQFGVKAPLAASNRPDPLYFSSPLHLQARLPHEESLLRLLTRLENELSAFVMMRGCNIGRSAPPGTIAPLIAKCEMELITLLPITEHR